MNREYRNEVWKLLKHDDYDMSRYVIKISNYGRILRKKPDEQEFKPVKPFVTNNFFTFAIPSLTKRNKYGKLTTRTLYVHKVVADLFIDKEPKKFVIHLDHDLKNNYVKNLKYVDQKELTKHQRSNPKFIKALKERKNLNAKLTETKVKLLKRKINDPNRRTRLRILAKQFGISEMQLYRIKTGENWGHVKEY